jgi:hypothetical protein
MNITNVSFPYPVLGLRGEESSDEADVMGHFEAPCEVAIASEVSVNIHYKLLHSPQLAQLIEDRSAAFACEVTCRKTAFRCVYTSPSPHQSFAVETDFLRDQIVLEFYIVAIADFVYSDQGGWHSDYAGRVFQITKGAVLAYGGEAKVLVQREPSGHSLGGSLIAVEPGTEKTGPFEVDLESDNVTIYLPTKTYLLFDNLYSNRPEYAATFHSSLVVPALAQALAVMSDSPQDYEDKKWFQAIETKLSQDPELRKFEVNQQNALGIAQRLIEYPFSEVTSTLAEQESSEVEE